MKQVATPELNVESNPITMSVVKWKKLGNGVLDGEWSLDERAGSMLFVLIVSQVEVQLLCVLLCADVGLP